MHKMVEYADIGNVKLKMSTLAGPPLSSHLWILHLLGYDKRKIQNQGLLAQMEIDIQSYYRLQ